MKNFIIDANVTIYLNDGSSYDDHITTNHSSTKLNESFKNDLDDYSHMTINSVDTDTLKNVEQGNEKIPSIEITREYSLGYVIKWSYKLDGKQSFRVYENHDAAMIGALSEKYLGVNEKISPFIIKLLNIKSAWSAK